MALATEECGCKIVASQIKAGDLFIVPCSMHAAAGDMLAALEEIALGQGRLSADQLQHATNCVEDMKAIAKNAAAAARGGA